MRRFFREAVIMLLLMTVVMSSCDDLIEPNITDKSIELVMPADKYVTSRNQIEFRWDGGDDLRTYRLQIVSPSFSGIDQFFADTLVSGTHIRLTLPPGNYEWRLRGENSGSHTRFHNRTFTIDTSSDFTKQAFAPASPGSPLYTNQLQVTFSWTMPALATKFEYQACDSAKAVLRTRFTNGSSLVDSFSEGVYYWRMRAFNETNNTVTAYSEFSKLVVDITSPAVHSQVTPVDGAEVVNNVVLTWQSSNEAKRYHLRVATDSTFSTLVIDTERESFPYTLPDLTENMSYYWTLRVADNCGNWSAFAKPYKFTVIP